MGNLLPNAPEAGATEEDLHNLVEAVGGHARSLVLIAREVGAAGVRRATENLQEVMRSMEAKHPGDRENSLLASAELSLRRLPAELRQLIGPLSVFHGGGSLIAIRLALQLDRNRLRALAHALIGVGLAEYVEPQYLRFDPALVGGNLTCEERENATVAWTKAIVDEVQFLYQQLSSKDRGLGNSLVLLELPNLLAVLDHLAGQESPERRALARTAQIRSAAAQRLSAWGHAQHIADRAYIERSS